MRRKMLKRWVAGVLVVALSVLTGCWDRRELEDLAFVLVLGLDSAPGGNLTVTLLLAKPAQLGGQSAGGSEKPFLVINATAPSLPAAFNVANSYSSRRITLIHTNAIVVGREAAEQGLVALDGLLRNPEVRGTAGFFVCEGRAQDLVENFPSTFERNPGKLMLNALATSKFTGFIPRNNLFLSLNRMESSRDDGSAILLAMRAPNEPLPPLSGRLLEGEYAAGEIPRQTNTNQMEFHGMAVFSSGKMVGTLTGAETTMLNMIRGDFGTGYFSIPDPYDDKFNVVMSLRSARKPQIEFSWADPDHPRASIRLQVEGDITSIQNAKIDYTRPEPMSALEQAISRLLEADGQRTVAKLQDMKSDALGLGHYIGSHFATFDEMQRYDWKQHFPNVKIDLTVKASVRRIGLLESPFNP